MVRRKDRKQLFAAVVLGLALALTLPSLVQSQQDLTDLGTWDGSWWHRSRDYNMAVWLRTVDGVPELKLQFFSLGRPEGFVTDWNGQATYEVRDGNGSFSMTLTERDGVMLKGTWAWELDLGSSGRSEHGEFIVYRAGDGRTLAIDFAEITKVIRRGDRLQTVKVPQRLSFRKASKRLVLWDELPL